VSRFCEILIDSRILTIRGQRVLLDSDLAELYGVETKRINEAIQRNRERFPDDFAFRLNKEEMENLKSQFATSSLVHGGARKPARVFTEHGVAMLSSVLRSPKSCEGERRDHPGVCTTPKVARYSR